MQSIVAMMCQKEYLILAGALLLSKKNVLAPPYVLCPFSMVWASRSYLDSCLHPQV